MHDIRNTEVYKQARRLVRLVYEESRQLPRSELYGLTMQMRKAANSVGANLMEAQAEIRSASSASS